MVKSSDIKKQIQEQDKVNYGDETESGSSPDNEQIQEEDTEELLEDVIGNNPSSSKGFNIGEEINSDESDL